MFSKPVAAMLLVGALALAAVAGGYIATRTLSVPDEDDASLELEPVPGEQAGIDALATPGGGESGGRRTSRPTASARRPLPSGSGGVAAGAPAGSTDTAGSANPSASVPTSRPIDRPATVEEVEVPAGQILDIQLQSPLSTETAKIEDPVETRVIKDARVGATLAIPAGAKVIGSVTVSDKGGRLSEPARLGVRFHTLVITGAPESPLVVDPIMLTGPSPAGDSKLKIAGGAAAGAVLGWLKGGASGAVTGGAIGGGAGTASKVLEGRKPAELPAGAQARIELRAPVIVTVRR